MRRPIMAVVLCATLATMVGCTGTPLTTREKGTLLGGALGAEVARLSAQRSVPLVRAQRSVA
jgi:hypothetical protein